MLSPSSSIFFYRYTRDMFGGTRRRFEIYIYLKLYY